MLEEQINSALRFLSETSTGGVLELTDDVMHGAVVAQLGSARLSEREVPGSILSDLNVCFDFPLIHVAIALNIRKTEH